MSATGLEVFDTTVQKTNRWLGEATGVLDQDKHTAYLAFRSTLHALRDRMTVEEVAHFAAQLPMLMRGFYYEGWDPTDKPQRVRTREEFLACITQELHGADHLLDPEVLARAVFAVLDKRITRGEVDRLKASLPEKIRELWPG